VKQQSLDRTPYLGVRLHQQRLARFAARLQLPVKKRFNLLPCFGFRRVPSEFSTNLIAAARDSSLLRSHRK
jgi:hypothetical protein